jgi:hypothetical protein
VHIELTSTLTTDDENRLAPAVLKALSGLLDMLPIAYLLRVETTDQNVMEHMSTTNLAPLPESLALLAPDSNRPLIES